MKTTIIIEIETSEMKKYISDEEDLTEELENEWHETIFNFIENKINDEDFEHNVMNEWIHEADFLNPKAKDFLDLGCLKIGISKLELDN